MKRCNLLTFFAAMIGASIGPANADSSCSAQNEQGTTCSVSCATGQQAYCVSPPNNNPPTCKCITASSGSSFHGSTSGLPKINPWFAHLLPASVSEQKP
jgi:hypothetical protein